MSEMLKIDLTQFSKSAREHINKDWPNFVVNGFSDVANHAKSSVHKLTRQRFNLHSSYITDGIRSYPRTGGQKSRAAAALKRFGDMNAAVYVRPSRSYKNSLEFMADHETGEDRTAQNKYIAVPTKTLKKKDYRTNKGRIKRSLKPKNILKRFNDVGSVFNGSTTTTKRGRTKRRRLPGAAFIMQGKSGRPFIARAARRGSNPLEFLYMLVRKVDIKKSWGFAEQVWKDVSASSQSILEKHAKRLKDYRTV